MRAAHFILYVREQTASARFYASALGIVPRLDVPGMTEFMLRDGCVLGLMPCAGARRLLPTAFRQGVEDDRLPHCELYLLVADAQEAHARALAAGATEVSAVMRRDWGDDAGYCFDVDGHVIAFAQRSNAVCDASDVSEIERLWEAWCRSLEQKDLDALMRSYAADVKFFDVKPPLESIGIERLRSCWAQCFTYFPTTLRAETRDLAVQVSGDLAFLACQLRFGPAPDFQKKPPPWFRVTRCYSRQSQEWRIVHEHCSMPFDPHTGAVVFNSEC